MYQVGSYYANMNSDDDSRKRRKLADGSKTVLTSDERDKIIESPNEQNSDNINNDLIYLDTIHKELLNFDFDKVCLVTLTNINLYCCLVCGKFYQGRAKSSPAYLHSINEDHRVFLNLDTENAYILPEDYKVHSPRALKIIGEIRQMIDPTFSAKDIENLGKTSRISHGVNHKAYTIGYVGLNNFGKNDYINVILQMLSHIPEIRDFYLSLSINEYEDIKMRLRKHSKLNDAFGTITRKIWSSHLTKGIVSPYEILQVILNKSKGQFDGRSRKSPKSFLIWTLNALHMQLSKCIGTKDTAISQALRGTMSIKKIPLETSENISTKKIDYRLKENDAREAKQPFWFLNLSLKESRLLGASLRSDSNIPEVSIEELLQKYNGKSTTQVSSNEVKTYQLMNPLPPFLVFYIDKGITREEVNSGTTTTVVRFPKIIDMAPFVLEPENREEQYRLISSILQNSSQEANSWSINICQDPESDQWVKITDIEVKHCDSELIFLEDNYIQVWQKI